MAVHLSCASFNKICTLCILAFSRTSVSGILSCHLIFKSFLRQLKWIRGMFENNIDFCYKKLYSTHINTKYTISLRESYVIRECDFCTNCIYTVGARADSFTMVTGTRGSPIICFPSIPLTAYKTVINQRLCLKFCHNKVLCHDMIS